ncbi:MAG: thrombospondin type 3 repeat-containing protein [Pseudomonadaceae bacterium]|nr:thrombospondin type 3 repeat-containing protein [Pseudomonadaceae bacterium]
MTFLKPSSVRSHLALLSIGLLLSACSGGSTISSSGDLQGGSSGTVVAGSVGDGPVIGATVTVYDANGVVLAEGTSDGLANYEIEVPEGAAFPVSVRATGGTDLVTGRAPDFDMEAVALFAGVQTVNVSPLTTIAVKAAECSRGGVSASTLQDALDAMTSHLHMGLDNDVVSNPMQDPIDTNNVADIVLASEAMGEMVRRTQSGLSDGGIIVSGDDIIDQIACDLAGDGEIDGDGDGVDERVIATARAAEASVLLEVASGALKVDGSDATSLMDDAMHTIMPELASGESVADVPVTDELIEQTRDAVALMQSAFDNPALPEIVAILDETPVESVSAVLETELASNGDLGEDLPTMMAQSDNETVSDVVEDMGELDSATAPIVSFDASNLVVDAGGSSRLSWASVDADRCLGDGAWTGEVALSGTQQLDNIQSDLIYQLTCTGLGGTTTSRLTIDVNDSQPPPPDRDGDGLPDASDPCPDDPTNTCNDPVDSDGDGIPDSEDECPNDPSNTCNNPPPPVDTDGDGIPDSEDECPTDPTNTCNDPPPPVDTDGDGIPDNIDECPTDPTNTCNDPVDSDGDGIPDSEDECPNDATNTCNDPIDSDGDGIPDESDECPNDATNTCNDPPPPPGEIGDYRGIPKFPEWTRNRNIDATYNGNGDVSGNGTEADPYVVSCQGNSVSLGSGNQMTVSGNYVSLVDCRFPNGRVKVSGNNIHLDNIHTSDISKAGFALSGSQIWVSNSSAKNHWASGLDRHGFQASCGSDYIVIVDSESSGNSGDGFQAGHGCSGARVRNIFVGGVTCEANRENCLDAKYVDGIVFSSMTSSGHGASGEGFESGSDGSSVIFGSDGDSLNAWLIDSTTSDPIGIRVEDGNGGVVLGNTFNGPTSVALQKHGQPLDIRNNMSTSSTFIGRADRAFNFCINVQGNVYSGTINSDLQSKAACLTIGNDTDISDLESRFQSRFGFPLQ